MFDEETNDCLQNNNSISSILKSKDWINDGLIGTPSHAFCRIMDKSSVEMYFNDFSVTRQNDFSKFDNHCRLERISPSLTVKKLKPEFAPLSLKSEVSHFSVWVL